MKNFIVGLILLMATAVNATEIGIAIDKNVNSSWKEALVINYSLGTNYQAYLNTEAVFSAPRQNMFATNHEYFGLVVGAKFSLPTRATLDVSTGGRYNWAGNSSGLPEGLEIGISSAKLSWKI